MCGCLDFDLTQGDDYLTVLNTMAFLGDYIGDFPAETKRKVVASLCSGLMNDGDHLQVKGEWMP